MVDKIFVLPPFEEWKKVKEDLEKAKTDIEILKTSKVDK